MTNSIRFLGLIAMAAAFAVAHTQSPHVWSNQNQYFLHGAAAAGVGDLANDWLANTCDPTPVFSRLVKWAFAGHGTAILSAVYFTLLMLYLVSIDRLLCALYGNQRRHRWLTLALVVVAHAACLRVASAFWLGKDYPWYLQAGVAGQYLLGPGLQPSAFGVFLITGLAEFATGRLLRAACWTALATLLHPGALLMSGLLVLGYQVELLSRRQVANAIAIGAVAFVIALPTLIYSWVTFAGGEPEQRQQAQAILVNVRLPHHCLIERWLDSIAILQLAGACTGLFLLRGTLLFRPLAVVAGLAAVLSIVQWVTGSHALALLFPWRVSVLLVPVALAVIADRLARLAKFAQPWQVAAGIAGVAAVGGIGTMVSQFGYQTNADERGVLEFVRLQHRHGDVYLLPVSIPDLRQMPAGSASMTFARSHLGMPTDFQQFRLTTGTGIYVDFKSIPYSANEVLEWHRRMRQCQEWYSRGDWDLVAEQLHEVGITCVVDRNAGPKDYRHFHEEYSDGQFRVLRLTPP